VERDAARGSRSRAYSSDGGTDPGLDGPAAHDDARDDVGPRRARRTCQETRVSGPGSGHGEGTAATCITVDDASPRRRCGHRDSGGDPSAPPDRCTARRRIVRTPI